LSEKSEQHLDATRFHGAADVSSPASAKQRFATCRTGLLPSKRKPQASAKFIIFESTATDRLA
jgi:hypothetical protein